MSCSGNGRPNPLPDSFNNLADVYRNSGVPGVTQLGQAMNAISNIDSAMSAVQSQSGTSFGQSVGNLAGAFFGGGLAVVVGIGLASLASTTFLVTGGALTAATLTAGIGVLAGLGSWIGETIGEHFGQSAGEVWDEAYPQDDSSRAGNGSDGRTPGSECGDSHPNPDESGGGSGGFSDLLEHPPGSPLVVDMDGDGIELLSLFDSGAMFDLDADGFAELTGWVSSDDALLAIDLNGNGRIDDINELFGNETTDGFIELAAYDSNSDGVINSNDAQYNDILVWQDNENGFSIDSDEIQTLAQAGIASINLNATSVSQTNAGHDISSISTVSLTGGGTREIADVWFRHNQTNSVELLPDNFVYNTDVFALPQLRGFGDVSELKVAMTNDSTLFSMVQNLVDADYSSFSFDDFSADVDAIMLRWTGAEGVNPASRGPNVDARHLEAAEAWQGRDFPATPNINTGRLIEEEWTDFVDNIAARLLVQIPITPLWKALNESVDIMKQFEAGGGDLDSLTVSETQALLDPAFSTMETDLANHPLARFKAIEYDLLTNEFSGPFADFITMLENNEPASSGAKDSYWEDLLPLLNAVADTQEVTDADYINSVTGTHLATIAPNNDIVSLRTDSILVGTSGNDTLQSSNNDDYIVGREGDDVLRGNGGDDVYAWSLGDGNDLVLDQQYFTNSSLADKLLLGPGINSGDLVLTRTLANHNDLVVTVNGQAGGITIQQHFDSVGGNSGSIYEVEQVQFDDGTILTSGAIEAMLLNPTSGDDVLIGYDDSEVIDGGAGNDTIFGGVFGDDTLKGGDGHDLIDQRDESLAFNFGNDDVIDGGAGNDTIYAAADEDSVDGGSGNDSIDAGLGDDTINGGSGNDTIIGGKGDDIIDGGAGKDVLTDTGSSDFFFSNKDVFVFSDLTHSTATNLDRITHFVVSDDKIDVSSLGFISLVSGTTSAGELRLAYSASSDRTYVRTDQSDFEFYLDGNFTGSLNSTHFIFDNDTIPSGGTINGTSGNDFLTGTASDDTINGLAGNDTITGAAGADSMDGGSGTDLLSYAGDTAGVEIHLNGVDQGIYSYNAGSHAAGDSIAGFEQLEGGSGNDILWGRASVSTVTGGNGNDYVNGLTGNDSLDGEAGNDTLVGGAGADTLTGGTGTDLLSYVGSAASVEIHLNGSDQSVWNSSGDAAGDIISSFEQLEGSAHNDSLWGHSNGSTVMGGNGNDYINGLTGNDALEGGNGNDSIYGGSENDTIEGNAGADFMHGDAGIDLLSYASSAVAVDIHLNAGDQSTWNSSGDAAGDTISSFEQLEGSAHNDSLWGHSNGSTVMGGNGNDYINGLTGNDSLEGGNGNDSVFGGNNNDTIEGNGGADFMHGDAGIDLLSYASSAAAVEIHMNASDQSTWNPSGDAAGDTIAGFEQLEGSIHNDSLYGHSNGSTIFGGDGNDYINGQAGGDWIEGQNGNDTIDGSAGRDTLVGGAGADIFDFSNASDSTIPVSDRVLDYVDGTDRFDVSAIAGITDVSDFTLTFSNGITFVTQTTGGDFQFLINNGDFTSSLTNVDFIF